MDKKECPFCRAEFFTKNKIKKYCSKKCFIDFCRAKAVAERKAEKAQRKADNEKSYYELAYIMKKIDQSGVAKSQQRQMADRILELRPKPKLQKPKPPLGFEP